LSPEVILLAISPLYLLYKMILPGFMQDVIYDSYYQNIGTYIDELLRWKTIAEETLTDLPNVTLACLAAGVETCIQPANENTKKYCWRYLGIHIEDWFLIPARDAHINRLLMRKRRRPRLRLPPASLSLRRERADRPQPAVHDGVPATNACARVPTHACHSWLRFGG